MQKTCEYCNATFTPREQVKRPRACNNSKCQKMRQRDNEKAWREKNKGLYDKKYYQIKSFERQKNLTTIINKIAEAIVIGFRFEGQDLSEYFDYICKLLTSVGIRKLNKLCIDFS